MTAVLNGNGVTSGPAMGHGAPGVPANVGEWCRAVPTARGAEPVLGFFLGSSVPVGEPGLDVVVATRPSDSAYEARVVRVAGPESVLGYAALPGSPPATLAPTAREVGRSAALTLLAGTGAAREAGRREGQAAEHAAQMAWRERLNEAMNEAADDNSLCSVYDDFCEEWGLTPREKEFHVTVEVSSLRVRVSAISAEAAEEQVTEEFLLEYARHNGFSFRVEDSERA